MAGKNLEQQFPSVSPITGLDAHLRAVNPPFNASAEVKTEIQLIFDWIGSYVAGKAVKGTPVAADKVLIADSEDSDKVKHVVLSNLIAALDMTLTNKTIDGDDNAISNLAIGSEVLTALTQKQEIEIPAEAMTSRLSNGAEYGVRELATNKNLISAMKFDSAADEFIQFQWTPPNNWDAGTIRFKAEWTNAAGLTTETISLSMAAFAYGDGDDLDQAFGAVQTVTDTWIGQDKQHKTTFSPDLTIGNSPSKGDKILFQVNRNTGSDNLTGDLELTSITIEFGIDDIGTN